MDALQIADDLFGAQLLLIDDTLEVIELLVHLFGDFILQSLLASDSFLHFLAFLQIICALFLNVFQMLKMHVRCLLQGKCFAPMLRIFKVAFVTEGSVVRVTVYL